MTPPRRAKHTSHGSTNTLGRAAFAARGAFLLLDASLRIRHRVFQDARRSRKAPCSRAWSPPPRAFPSCAGAASFLRNLSARGGARVRARGRREKKSDGGEAVPFRDGGERGRGGAPFPYGVQASLGLLAGFRTERAHLLRAHLRGVPQGQVLHHRARAPRPVACRRVWVLYRKRLSFFFIIFVRLSTDALLISFGFSRLVLTYESLFLAAITPDVFPREHPTRPHHIGRRAGGGSDTRGKGPGAMVLATDEKTPLRVAEEGDRRRDDAASSGADRHHAHRVSHRNADAAALRPDAFPAVDDADAEHRRAIRGLVRSMGAAATAATAAALVVVVWTQRTHTLQDSWRPVPGLDLHATLAADEGVAGTSAGGAFAGALAAVRVHPAARGWRMPRRASARAKGMLNHPRLRFTWTTTLPGVRALLGVRRRIRGVHAAGRRPRALRVPGDAPWRVLEPCDASVFVVPALPASIPTSARPECAGRASTRRRSARRRSRGGAAVAAFRRAGARTTRCSNRRAATRSSCPRPRRATRRARARALAKEKQRTPRPVAAGRRRGRAVPRGGQAAVLQDGRGPRAPARAARRGRSRRRRPRCPQRRARRRTPPRRRAPRRARR